MGTNKTLKKQIAPMYDALCALLKPYLWLKYGFSVPKDLPRLPEGPILLLGSHMGNLDFLFALCSFKGKRFHPIVAAHFFANKRVAWLLNFFRCIKKEQFRADISSISKMRAAIAMGESLLIYPEGEVNGTGRTGKSVANTARLAKLLRVPVYGVRTYGSYFTRPKWNEVQKRGKVELEAELIADVDDVENLSTEELFEKIEQTVFCDDYAWQEKARVLFNRKNRAFGLDRLLYVCPRCKKEYTLAAQGDEIFCQSCGNRGTMDEYGFLSPNTKTDVIPRYVPDWVELQREALRKEIANGNFSLSAPCSIQYHLRENSLKHDTVGKGTVILDMKAISYVGTALGEQVELSFPIDNILKIPFDMGLRFDIPNTVRTISIMPDNFRMNQKFVLALPLIHEYLQDRLTQTR